MRSGAIGRASSATAGPQHRAAGACVLLKSGNVMNRGDRSPPTSPHHLLLLLVRELEPKELVARTPAIHRRYVIFHRLMKFLTVATASIFSNLRICSPSFTAGKEFRPLVTLCLFLMLVTRKATGESS